MKPTTFWEIERAKSRAAKVLFLIFFPFFTLSMLGLFYLLKFFWGIFRGGGFWEFLLASSFMSLILYFMAKAGAKRQRILNFLISLKAQKPDLQDLKHRQVQNVVREMAIAASVPEPEVYIIPVLARNAFSAFDIISITEGAVSSLERDELQAVVAHEMAHYLRGDSYYKGIISTFIMAISTLLGASLFLSGVNKNRDKNRKGGGWAWDFIIVVIYLYLINLMARLLNAAISRKMEDLADARAVQFTRNPLALASALYKVSRDRVRGLASFASPALSSLFIVPPNINSLDEGHGFFSNLFSTHPPTRKRIGNLLNLAHADWNTLRQKAVKKRLKGDFWVERDGKWIGPFTLEELLEKTWVGEGAKIKGKEGTFIFGPQFLQKFTRTQGNCPRCGGPLYETHYEFVPIIRCGRCGGILVREDRAMKLIARGESLITRQEMEFTRKKVEKTREKLISGGANPKTVDPSSPLKCPFCGRPMERKFFNFVTYTPVDFCPKCKYYFFDGGELETIIAGLKRIDSLYK